MSVFDIVSTVCNVFSFNCLLKFNYFDLNCTSVNSSPALQTLQLGLYRICLHPTASLVSLQYPLGEFIDVASTSYDHFIEKKL
jgi:hypothetical protein